MKKTVKLLGIMLAAVALSGCVQNANQQNSSTKTAETVTDSTTESLAAGGQSEGSAETVTIAMESGGRTLDPAAATDASSATFVNAAYDQLVTFGTIEKDGYVIANPEDIQPSLAKSWEESEDGLEYVFYLDERARFANGDPVDAEAVIYSLERVKNSNTSSFLFALTNIETMEKIDDLTVKFQLSQPSAIFYKLLQMHILSIINPNELAAVADVDDYLQNNTAGSGAFTIASWEPTTQAELTAREDYWKGAAVTKTIKISFISESSNRVLLVDKGDIDITSGIPAKDLAVLEGNEQLDLVTYDSNEMAFLILNNTREPFTQTAVRQALNYAVPYDLIVSELMAGKAKRLNHVVPSAMPAYFDDQSIYEYNPEKAKQMLTEAGYGDGFAFTLTVSNGKQEWMDLAILIQSELADIGVTVTIDKLERPQYLEAVKAKNIDAAIGTYTAFVNDPGYLFGNTLHSQGEYNYASYSSQEVDQLWAEAEIERDLKKRNELFINAQKIVEADAPWVNLFEKEYVLILNKNIKQFVYFPDTSLRFYYLQKAVD